LARGEDLGEMVGLLFWAKFVKPVLNFGKDTPVLNLPVGCDYADTFWVKTVWVQMEKVVIFFMCSANQSNAGVKYFRFSILNMTITLVKMVISNQKMYILVDATSKHGVSCHPDS
jgi:hypothetical protein